jgi:hypothetical protein
VPIVKNCVAVSSKSTRFLAGEPSGPAASPMRLPPCISSTSCRCTCLHVIEAPWRVNGGHGASLRHHK